MKIHAMLLVKVSEILTLGAWGISGQRKVIWNGKNICFLSIIFTLKGFEETVVIIASASMKIFLFIYLFYIKGHSWEMTPATKTVQVYHYIQMILKVSLVNIK